MLDLNLFPSGHTFEDQEAAVIEEIINQSKKRVKMK